MLQRLHLRNSNFVIITFRHDINLHGMTCTEAEIQRKAPLLIKLVSRQFLGNSPKISSQQFFKTFLDG